MSQYLCNLQLVTCNLLLNKGASQRQTVADFIGVEMLVCTVLYCTAKEVQRFQACSVGKARLRRLGRGKSLSIGGIHLGKVLIIELGI